ncbi:restriction endonuclease subunit S [uncultured Brachyspira sp.]|uniref:restriction endonuclease subunit S n=1 Tax=uncultured Brachyspira sp. TaxID=221953 RepID=UPI0032203E34
MSNFEDLIKKHCPDGVEYKTLEDVCIIYTGEQLNRKNMIKEGYPVINGGIQASGYTNNFNEYEETITISQGGASAGFVNFMLEKFWAGAHCYIIKPNTDKLINKYLFFVLKNIEIHIMELKNGAGIPGINKNKITKIKIPLPPIEVQKEIVRILDIFTKYQDLLNRELELRKKQYEYYRDKLLTFDNNIEFKSLSECILNTNNIKWNINQDKKFKYIDLSSVSRENNQILECQVIDYETAPSRAQQIVIKDDVIFGTTRPMLKRMCIIPKTYDNQICSTGFCVLRANKQIVLPKWILYCISTKDFFIYVDKNQKGASYPAILDKEVKKYKIPVPPLEEQERIVKILDQFDTLCNDITRGLPAEIELRKKQYEYYRDKLLTFKEKKK